MALPRSFNDICWYGRGPHECYPDRKESGLVRQWEAKVGDFPVKYVVPSESGGRADVRWAAISSDKVTLACFPADSDSFKLLNVSPYSDRDVHSSNHWSEIQPSSSTHLHLDHFHMGVGGDDSWSPCVHKEYLVGPGKYSFGYHLQPFLKAAQE